MSGDESTIARTKLAFRSVNRIGSPGYRAGLQRHHLLPCAALHQTSFAAMFATLGSERIGFDDFRRNGLLLPANEPAARQLGLPLHRGPHRCYNELVFERLGAIEHVWSRARRRCARRAADDAMLRIELLQRALRKRLLAERRPLLLNRADPTPRDDFSALDAMAAVLWPVTAADT